MELPSDVQFLEDLRLLVYRPHGVIDETAINKILSVLGDLESNASKQFNRFFDTLTADEIDLNFKYIMHISLYRRLSYTGKPPVKSAILATDSSMVHYAKLHALMTRGSPIDVRVFAKRAEAAQWLDVPRERLRE